MPTKICKTCKIEKTFSEFDLHYGKPRPHCKPCTREIHRIWYAQRTKERGVTYVTEYSWKIKSEAIKIYGGACYCCGETIEGFLTLDHANNDGNKARGNKRSGNTIYKQLYRDGWPQDLGIRVACFNCNCGRQVNGGVVCPHQGQTIRSTPVRLRPGPKPFEDDLGLLQLIT